MVRVKVISKTYCTPLATPLSSTGFLIWCHIKRKFVINLVLAVNREFIWSLTVSNTLLQPLNMCWNKKIPSRNGVMNQSITQKCTVILFHFPEGQQKTVSVYLESHQCPPWCAWTGLLPRGHLGTGHLKSKEPAHNYPKETHHSGSCRTSKGWSSGFCPGSAHPKYHSSPL